MIMIPGGLEPVTGTACRLVMIRLVWTLTPDLQPAQLSPVWPCGQLDLVHAAQWAWDPDIRDPCKIIKLSLEQNYQNQGIPWSVEVSFPGWRVSNPSTGCTSWSNRCRSAVQQHILESNFQGDTTSAMRFWEAMTHGGTVHGSHDLSIGTL
jgi:hypothetical protein